MAFPPAFLDELRERVPLSDIVARKVTWDRRKSQPAKGDHWACCPFHQETTPSFHVVDPKGFYHCFGCGAKGSHFDFLMETEGLSFPEAVEAVAAIAGMEVPREPQSPEAERRKALRDRLAEVMEVAAKRYRLAYRGAGGQIARDYAEGRRGLTAETLDRFGIGYAPDQWQFLTESFESDGRIEDAIAAGLVTRSDKGRLYDRFRGRLMFPIRDRRGTCIAFGARALSADQEPKYLNSSETELFSKSRVLFNLGPAREAAGKAGTVIVAEGYMDVIALAQAGIGHAVAPLGTAVTEEQLDLLWRMAPEPVLALDGDKAGIGAAHRVVDLALPKIGPGRSVRFCLMPEGRDPDDLIRAEGRAGMEAALSRALPLVEMLWRREVAAGPLETPEQKADLDRRLREALGRIADRGVRRHYGEEIARRRREASQAKDTRPKGRWSGPPARGRAGQGAGARGGRRWGPPDGPTAESRASDLVRSAAAAARIREAGILLMALRHPSAAMGIEAELEEMPVETADFRPLRDALVDALGEEDGDLRALVTARLGADPDDLLSAVPQARSHPLARRGADPERVAAALAEAIGRHRLAAGFRDELSDGGEPDDRPAREDVDSGAWNDRDHWTYRLSQMAAARQSLEAGVLEDDDPDDAEDTAPASSAEGLPALPEPGPHSAKKRGDPPSNQ